MNTENLSDHQEQIHVEHAEQVDQVEQNEYYQNKLIKSISGSSINTLSSNTNETNDANDANDTNELNENPFLHLSNDELLKEFLYTYCDELFSHSKSKNIIIPSKSYLKLLDSQAEYLDYFHMRSMTISEKVLPSLKAEEFKLRKLFLQIDALNEFINSYTNQITHLNDVLHDIDAHTKKYSKLVPNFLRAKPKLNSTLFGLNIDTLYLTVDQFIENIKENFKSLPQEAFSLNTTEIKQYNTNQKDESIEKQNSSQNSNQNSNQNNSQNNNLNNSQNLKLDQKTIVKNISSESNLDAIANPTISEEGNIDSNLPSDTYNQATLENDNTDQVSTNSQNSSKLSNEFSQIREEKFKSNLSISDIQSIQSEGDTSSSKVNTNTIPQQIIGDSEDDNEDEGEVIFAEGESDEDDD